MDKNKYDKIYNFLKDNEDISLYDVVDVVVQSNGFVGVGIVTLADELRDHLYENFTRGGDNEYTH